MRRTLFRVGAVILCVAFLASSCALDPGSAKEAASYPPWEPKGEEVSLVPSRQIDPILYFPNRNRTKLTAESRQLLLAQDEVPERAIVAALLEGPETAELRSIGIGFTLNRVEVMPDVINVYLNRDREFYITQDDEMCAKFSIATTLIDFSGCRYVNVLIDGMQTQFTDSETNLSVPTGALTRVTDLVDAFNALEQKAAAQNPDMYAVLYYLDRAESYLIPEVHRIVFSGEQDMVELLVAELLQGPENTFNCRQVIDPQVALLAHEIVPAVDGSQVIRLVFNRFPVVYTNNFKNGENLALGALAYTLVDFVPNVSAIEVSSHSSTREPVTIRPSEFMDLIGTRVQICLPNTPNGMTMTNIERVLPQAQGADPKAVLSALFEGPLETDSQDVWPAVPAGISIDDLRDIYVAGDMIVLDLAEHVTDVLRNSPEQDERVMLFSIINTLTSFEGVRRVLFLVEGKREEYLASETISILDPLIKNPGIIK